MAAPPALELKIAIGFGIDMGVQVVLLVPPGVGRIEAFEVLHQPGPVEQAIAHVREHMGGPAAAGHAAGIAHRRLAALPGPVGQRCTGDQDRSEQLGLERCRHHDLPARLTVAHDHRFFAIGMQLRDVAQEGDLGFNHVLDPLPRDGIGHEGDEVAGMAGAQCDTDLAVGLEATDTRAMPGARVDHHEGACQFIGLYTLGRVHAQKLIVDGARQGLAFHHDVGIEAKYGGAGLLDMFEVFVAALAHDIPVEDAALDAVTPVVGRGTAEAEGVEQWSKGFRQREQGRGGAWHQRIHIGSQGCVMRSRRSLRLRTCCSAI